MNRISAIHSAVNRFIRSGTSFWGAPETGFPAEFITDLLMPVEMADLLTELLEKKITAELLKTDGFRKRFT